MKKTMAIVLLFVFLVSLYACAGKTPASQQIPGLEEPAEDGASGSEKPAAGEEKPQTVPENTQTAAPAELPPNDANAAPEERTETVPEPTDTGIASAGPELPPENEPVLYWYDTVAEDFSWRVEDWTEQVSVRIPAFNSDSADAALLNDRIESDASPFLADIYDAKENGYSPACGGILYEAWVNGDAVSLLMDVSMPNDVHYYYAYNLNILSGTEMSGPDIMKLSGYTEDSFVLSAQSAVAEYFRSCYGELMEDPFVMEQYEKTMSADGYGSFLPMFFGNDGALGFVIPVYSVAGADSYETVFYLHG